MGVYVRTFVEALDFDEILETHCDDSPWIVPAPAPCEYKEIVRPRWSWRYFKHQIAHKWFLFKITYGLIRDERSWLFKR